MHRPVQKCSDIGGEVETDKQRDQFVVEYSPRLASRARWVAWSGPQKCFKTVKHTVPNFDRDHKWCQTRRTHESTVRSTNSARVILVQRVSIFLTTRKEALNTFRYSPLPLPLFLLFALSLSEYGLFSFFSYFRISPVIVWIRMA